MKGILPLLLLGTTFFVGCSDSRRAQLTGTWQDAGNGTLTLNADASFSGDIQTGSWGILTPQAVYLTGTWRLSGGFIVLHINHATYENEKLSGMELSEKLLDVDRNSFRTRDKNGKETVYTRIN